MNASLRDLAARAGAVPAPPLDLATLVSAGETRIRRRRLAALAAVTAAVLAVVGGAALAGPGTRRTAPQPAVTDHKKQTPDVVVTPPAHRELVYGVGTTIHWGTRTIDVGRQAHGRHVKQNGLDYVDATDDGAVFITGFDTHKEADGTLSAPAGDAAVWFTDGSAPVRIGTTIGNFVRGFQIASSAEGSTLVWNDGRNNRPGQVVVYDTALMREVARFGDADASALAVYDDVVYWNRDAAPCAVQGDFGCLRTRWVMRFEKATGQQTRVVWADYEADRRARPGVLSGRYDGDAHVVGDVLYDSIAFDRRGDRLVSGASRGVVVPLTVANTGRPLRLRLPSGFRQNGSFRLVQWLGADRVAVFAFFDMGGSESNDSGDILVCQLSTSTCQLAVRGNRHTAYAVPMGD